MAPGSASWAESGTGYTGPELVAKTEALAPGTPAFFISGYAEEAWLEEGHGEALPILRKPFSKAVLARWVRRTLDGVPADGTADEV